MKVNLKVVKMRRVIEFYLMFLIVYLFKMQLLSRYGSPQIVKGIGIILLLTAIVFIVVEVRSSDDIDTGKAILEHQFESEEEMKSMPSNFWYNRAVTNKQNALLSPELIGGTGTALIFNNITYSILMIILFWFIDYTIRIVSFTKRDNMMSIIGSEGKAITQMAWDAKNYLGVIELNNNKIHVKIDKNSEAISIGDFVKVIGLDGMKYIIEKVK